MADDDSSGPDFPGEDDAPEPEIPDEDARLDDFGGDDAAPNRRSWTKMKMLALTISAGMMRRPNRRSWTRMQDRVVSVMLRKPPRVTMTGSSSAGPDNFSAAARTMTTGFRIPTIREISAKRMASSKLRKMRLNLQRRTTRPTSEK
jgi:hypothetical protein